MEYSISITPCFHRLHPTLPLLTSTRRVFFCRRVSSGGKAPSSERRADVPDGLERAARAADRRPLHVPSQVPRVAVQTDRQRRQHRGRSERAAERTGMGWDGMR